MTLPKEHDTLCNVSRNRLSLIFVGVVIALLSIFVLLKLRMSHERHYVINCSIFSPKLKLLWSFDAPRCWFQANGKVLVGNHKIIELFDSKMNSEFKLPIPNHHQLNFFQNHYYSLSQKFELIDGKNHRIDWLVLISLDGNILAEINLTKIFEESLGSLPSVFIESMNYYEMTHVNSIYEIPENPLSSSFPSFATGNIIINDNLLQRAFIFNPDLSKILWIYQFPADGTHDVQITPDGQLLYFANRATAKASQIVSVDLSSNQETILFESGGGEIFFQPTKGFVQKLGNGQILFTYKCDSKKELIEYNLFSKKITQKIDLNPILGVDEDHASSVKKVDLSEFLEHNSGL